MSFQAADGSGIRTEELRVRLGDDALRGLGGPAAFRPGLQRAAQPAGPWLLALHRGIKFGEEKQAEKCISDAVG